MPEENFSPAARWISAENAAGKKNVFVRFYRSFELQEVPAELFLKITAECYYALWINGRYVAHGPVRGTSALQYFDKIDIAGYVNSGVNHLAVLVHSPCVENFVAAPGTEAPALLLEIAGVLASDQNFRAQLAPDYFNTAEYFTMQTGFMEDRDLTLAPDDKLWTVGKGGAENWSNAQTVEPFLTKELLQRDIPPTVQRAILPVSIVRTANVERQSAPDLRTCQELAAEKWSFDAFERFENIGSLLTAEQSCTILPAADNLGAALVLDLGQDYTGYGEFEIECSAPGVLFFVNYGEYLTKNQTVRLDYKHISYGFIDRYKLAAGKNAIGSRMCERGGRYLQLIFHNITAPVTLKRVCFNEHRYDFGNAGSFRCSDTMLNAIWDACAETLKVCTTDIFTDCPWRERSFWVNDLVVENRTSLAAFGASALHKRAFKLAFSQQREDGWVPGVCPAPREKEPKWVLPATNLFLFLMLDDYYMASGDWQTAAEYLPNLEKILLAVEKERDADGTVAAPKNTWHFYDWGFEFTDQCFRKQRESMFCFLYGQAVNIYVKFMLLAGKEFNKAELLAKRDAAVNGAYKRFLDPVTGLIADNYGYYHYHENAPETLGRISHQLSHALALLYTNVPQEYYKNFSAALADESMLKPDLYLQSFVLRALNLVGNDAAALQRIRRYWGRIIDDGGKTIYENGIAKFAHELGECGSTGSMCHGFATAPLEFLQISTLGIKAQEPAFARFTVDPRPLDLDFAEGRVPTPNGDIAIKYTKCGDTLKVKLHVPGNCTAVLNDKRELAAGIHEFELKIQ